MTSLGWKIRRLRAMSLQEIGVRAMRMVRERVAPLPKEAPEQTWRRWYNSQTERQWLSELPQKLPLHPECVPDSVRACLIGEADEILQGRWQLFGYSVNLSDPPDWNLNPVLGKAWMAAPAKQIDYRRIDIAGGVKYVWELSRHQPLLRLAQAYALTGEARYAETCLRWWLDWVERNPRGWGIHWTSALEHAIRVFVWLYGFRLLSNYAPLREVLPKLGGALIQHGEFIERHLSPGSSANNHLIGEVASLAFAGTLLPPCPLTQRWMRLGYRTLEQEALRQFYEDGVNAEQAFGYLPFVWEFYLHAYRLNPMPDAVRERLARSVAFVRNVMDASGYVPQVGDEDDGTVVPMWSMDTDRHRVVGRALAVQLGCEPPPRLDESDDTLTYWLFGKGAPEGSRLTESRVYPVGGYAVLHSARWQVLFDAGPLGLGSLAAHGHADALAVCASLDGKPLLVDTGTYAYHEDPAWRDHFRGTAAHNTVQRDQQNQSEILGPFLWGRKATASLYADPAHNEAEGTHDGYQPDRHKRRVQLREETLLIEDTVVAQSAQVWRWHWHFHPRWQVHATQEGWYITDGESECTLTVEGLPAEAKAELIRGAGEEPSVGWYSPRFGQKVPCTTLRVEVAGGGANRQTLLRWRFQAR